ncbi:MAG: glycosyltransferase family 2 protein, partial [Anaerovoracaceae bacterium]
MPKISVVIPAYNLETELSDMLDSLLKQSFCDYEAIIVNDGSSDRTEIIAEEFSDKDKRFRFISQKNQGVSSARNRGIECARGDYLIFFDGDDFIPADSLKNLYDSIIKNNRDMAVGIMETYSDGTS